MFDEEVVVQEQEAVEVVGQDTQQQQQQEREQQQQQEREQQRNNDIQANMRALREAKEASDRAARENYQRAEEYERRFRQLETQKDEVYTNPRNPDDIAEIKDLIPVDKEVKQLRRELKEHQELVKRNAASVALNAAKMALNSKFSDFNKIVSPENIERLSREFPEITKTLDASDDAYATGVAAYNIIKKMGIARDESFDADKITAQRNAAKPKPLTSLNPQQGDSPLSHANAFANGLSKEYKESLYRQMQESIMNH